VIGVAVVDHLKRVKFGCCTPPPFALKYCNITSYFQTQQNKRLSAAPIHFGIDSVYRARMGYPLSFSGMGRGDHYDGGHWSL
jgi:hypothetical protein